MKASRLWEYDDDDEPISNTAIGPLDEPVKTDGFCKIFAKDKAEHGVPQIVIFGTRDAKEGILIRLEFTGDRPEKELDRFWEMHCRTETMIQLLVDRWGEARVQWGGPGYKKSDLTAELVAYYEEDGGSAWLDRNFPVRPRITYRELFSDFEFLQSLYESKKVNHGTKR